MKYYKMTSLFVSSVILFSANAAFASSYEDEFSACASMALEDRVSDSTVFSVDLSELESITATEALNTRSAALLDLTLVDASSGVELGDVICMVDSAGNVVSAEFTNRYGPVALN